MTLSPWIIYLWGIADNVISTLRAVGFVFAAAAVIFKIYGFTEGSKTAQTSGSYMAVIGLLTSFGAAVTPSSRTIAVMVVAPAIVNSEPIQKDLPELYKAAKDALMKTLAE